MLEFLGNYWWIFLILSPLMPIAAIISWAAAMVSEDNLKGGLAVIVAIFLWLGSGICWILFLIGIIVALIEKFGGK